MKPEVVFSQVRPKGPKITALLGDGNAVPVADSGWEVVSRPKRKGFTSWNGYGPVTMSVPILLDGFADNRTVEPAIDTLYKMMRNVDEKIDEPPVIRVSGPVPYTKLQWVITGIDHGDEIRRKKDGRRVRAFMTINLMEYVAADVMQTKKSSPAKSAQGRKDKKKDDEHKSSSKTYRVKKGDTLSKIAVHLLGSANDWHKIAKLNHIRDPRNIKVGQVLRIPSK